MAYVEPRDGWRPQHTEVHKILAFLEKKGVDMAAGPKEGRANARVALAA